MNWRAWRRSTFRRVLTAAAVPLAVVGLSSVLFLAWWAAADPSGFAVDKYSFSELLVVGGFIAAAVVVALAAMIAARIRHTIGVPLIELARFARTVGESKDYSLRAPVHGSGELGQLAGAVNQMLSQIQARDAILQNQVHQRSTELEKITNEFRHRAFHDSLTGLPNQALLSEYFQLVREQAEREKGRFCLLMLDVDNFKVINDTLGHDFGDQLLVHIARRIERAVRRDDMIFRLGGDEFVILATRIHQEEDVEAIANHILERFRKDVLVEEQRIKATISIGGAIYPEQGLDLVSIKRNADIAMYRAKENGKNRFQMFQASMEAVAMQRMMVQNDLRSGISNGELVPHFQPKIDALRSLVVGCEVLIRWRHPKHGFLMPGQFVPFAEENGLVRVMDYHILELACRSAREWQDKYGYRIPVAVNLSGVHFRDRDIVSVVAGSLEEVGLSPDLLELELTEAVLIGDPQVALATLNDLKALGVRVSLDDFGIGYSSLHYLRTLPVDVVKLDKSFIQNLTVSAQDRQLTSGIIALASELGFEVVAEGVETVEQLEQLVQLNCGLMQGYHFCKPCSEDDFLRWIGKESKHGYVACTVGQALSTS